MPPVPRATRSPLGQRQRRFVLGVLCLALLVVGIDGTIVNVALPAFVQELGATNTQLQWIVDAYTIIFAGFLLIAGATGDRLGRKRSFITGLTVFTAGSLACALTQSAHILIFFRGLQGLGAAFIMPATLSILANVFTDPAERARAIAIWAGVSGLGVAIGPLAGGWLLMHFWWGAIFLVNVPLGILTIIAARWVPESRDEAAPRLDWAGSVLSIVGLIALLFGIIEGPSQGWSNPVVIISFVVAVAFLVGFVLVERAVDNPILDLSFFADARFTAATVAVTLVFFAMFGSVFFTSQFLQFVLGYSAFRSGAALLPVAVVLMVSAPLAAKLAAHLGTKIVVASGLALVALGLYLFSFTTATSGYLPIAGMLVIVGIGMGTAMAPATDAIMGSIPAAKAGVGAAVNDTTREIGGALGVAVLGSITTGIYAARITAHPSFATLQHASPQAAEAVRSSVGGAALVAEHLPPDLARALTNVANAAFIAGIQRALIVGAAVALAGAIVALVFLPARARGVDPVDRLVAEASRHLPRDPERRLHLARSALELFADAGMSSLTYNALSARSGVATATLERHWKSGVDAVTDALSEILDSHAIPQTGDLAGDLRRYLYGFADLLADEDARRVLRALVTEAGTDETLATALRDRILGPRAKDLAERIANADDSASPRPRHPFDQLMGPLYARALLTGPPPDHDLVDAVIDALIDRTVATTPTRTEAPPPAGFPSGLAPTTNASTRPTEVTQRPARGPLPTTQE